MWLHARWEQERCSRVLNPGDSSSSQLHLPQFCKFKLAGSSLSHLLCEKLAFQGVCPSCFPEEGISFTRSGQQLLGGFLCACYEVWLIISWIPSSLVKSKLGTSNTNLPAMASFLPPVKLIPVKMTLMKVFLCS